MSGNDGHFGRKALNKLHVSVKNSTENGACLTGHESSFSKFKKKNSCNYRYQGYEQADSKAAIKRKLHSYKSANIRKPIETSAYKSDKGDMTPAYYCAVLPPPEDGDWDIGGPHRDITRKTFQGKKVKIPKAHNFTQDTWPYWNNAHHLIPKGTLKERIHQEEAKVCELIQAALLTAKYNINHKVNMLLMPQDQEVAKILGLPRHIQLKEGDAPDIASVCTDHPLYNALVLEIRSGLDTIVKGYRDICKSALDKVKKTHKTPKATLDKKKLENLSKRLLDLILTWNSKGTGSNKRNGLSLDAISAKLKPALKRPKLS